MGSDKDADPIFKDLLSIQPSLSKNNQVLIPALINLFGEFRAKVVADLTLQFNSMATSMENDCLKLCQAKDAEISSLKTLATKLEDRCHELEDKLDASEAYSRKDSIIISGAVPAVSNQENLNNLTVTLLNSKFPESKIELKDISICHRLQSKNPLPDQARKPPNIYVKLVRRNVKQMLIRSSKKQAKTAVNKIFINESLTPARSKVMHTLLDLKKRHETIRGVTSMDGNVYAYTAATPRASGTSSSAQGRPRDVRHLINNHSDLQKFCDAYLRRPLELLLESNSA